MNRRVFVTAGAAALALGANRVAAQAGDSDYTTELTGSVIDLMDSGFEFGQIQSDGNQEIVELISGEVTAGIYFLPPFTDFQVAIDTEVDAMSTNLPSVEVVDSEIFDDGAWALMQFQDDGVQTVKYGEIQAGAYPDFDLVIELISQPDAYEDMITAFQKITIDGMPPFLFLEDSDSIALVAAIVPATTSSRTSRSSRGSNSGTTTTTTTRSSRSSRSSTSNTSTGDDGSYREAVRTHRNEFQLTIVDFAVSLGVLTDTNSSKAQTDTALLDVDALAEEWITYPDQAAKLTAPTAEKTLADLYTTWCDEIALLAETWQAARVGDSDADAILSQFEVVLDADDALGVELDDAAMRGRRTVTTRIGRLSTMASV